MLMMFDEVREYQMIFARCCVTSARYIDNPKNSGEVRAILDNMSMICW